MEQKILIFNKLSRWSRHDWQISNARCLLAKMPGLATKWVKASDMTEEEKEEYPEHETTGGYLKTIDRSKYRQEWWDKLSKKDKLTIKSIPNFNARIFKEITGIKV